MGRVVSIALLCVVLSADSSMAGQAEPGGEFPITSWQALPFWSPAGSTAKVPVDGGSSPAMTADLTTPMPFVAVTPCRIVDTRNAPGALGGPALTAGTARSFTLAGYCGVPVDAKAVSMNATVSLATSQGSLTLYPGGGDGPGTSAISFPVGRDRANNAILGLTGGVLSVRDNQTTGTVHFIVDVNGYFR